MKEYVKYYMMKEILTIVLFSLSVTATSQTASVEKSIFGVQTGFLGIWVHHEAKLSRQIVLRSEIGLDASIWGGTLYDYTGFLMTPVITAEPRWYYNLDRRESNSKEIEGNSGNFISLKTSYNPDWFVISNYDGNISHTISIVSTWGLRRNIGEHFNYETGIGVGYRYIFAKQAGYPENSSEVAVNLHLRIGYKF